MGYFNDFDYVSQQQADRQPTQLTQQTLETQQTTSHKTDKNIVSWHIRHRQSPSLQVQYRQNLTPHQRPRLERISVADKGTTKSFRCWWQILWEAGAKCINRLKSLMKNLRGITLSIHLGPSFSHLVFYKLLQRIVPISIQFKGVWVAFYKVPLKCHRDACYHFIRICWKVMSFLEMFRYIFYKDPLKCGEFSKCGYANFYKHPLTKGQKGFLDKFG